MTLLVHVLVLKLPGLYPRQFKGDPQTLMVATVAPLSVFKTIKCPSVLPAAKATPNGWKTKETHSYNIWKQHVGEGNIC